MVGLSPPQNSREQDNSSIRYENFIILTHAHLISTGENCPCALFSGSFSVPLSSSVLVELGYASSVQKERHEFEDITLFNVKKHCTCASGVPPRLYSSVVK